MKAPDSQSMEDKVVWLAVFGGLQLLGLVFTLVRLAYDEWQQWRLSRKAPAAMEDRPSQTEYASWKTATI